MVHKFIVITQHINLLRSNCFAAYSKTCPGLKVGLASLMAYNWPGPKFWPGLKNRPGLIFGLYKKFWRHFFFFTFFIDFLHFKIRLIFLKLKTVFCLNYDTPDYHIDFELISVDLFN